MPTTAKVLRNYINCKVKADNLDFNYFGGDKGRYKTIDYYIIINNFYIKSSI